MAEIVNLKRVKKAGARIAGERAAEANRTKHGTPKHLRKMARAEAERTAQALDAHQLAQDKTALDRD